MKERTCWVHSNAAHQPRNTHGGTVPLHQPYLASGGHVHDTELVLVFM